VVEVTLGATTDTEVELRFRVRDTGIGIPDSAHERVFQAFAQADGSMSRRYGGTGLGLAITRGLVELMGGVIDFTSEVGRGTAFHFNVRLRRPAAPAAPIQPCTILAGLTVLVVEDNAAQREVIAETFRNLGAEAVLASAQVGNAVEQWRRAEAGGRKVDLVFFDADLPGSDLIQTARRLRIGGKGSSRLIALIPPGAVADVRGLEAAGVSGTLVKPLRQSRLPAELRALLLGEPEADPTPAPSNHAEAAPGKGLTVLLVEDQVLNRRVAAELLERLGARVDSASNGSEAVQACERRRYDLVLMDCQMPGMDGYEATRRIRDAEKRRSAEGGRPHRPVPIVALSANALADDRDRGREAGMDDYLTKPLFQPELVRILHQVTGQQPATVVRSETPPEAPEYPVFDPEPLKALATPDDPDALPDFVRQFLTDAPLRLARLRDAAQSGAAAALRSEAHGFKGNASYMGLRRLVQLCAQLERAAKEGDLSAAGELLPRLDAELTAAQEALEGFVAGRFKP
jgi:CheY-like chemotaxis protein